MYTPGYNIVCLTMITKEAMIEGLQTSEVMICVASPALGKHLPKAGDVAAPALACVYPSLIDLLLHLLPLVLFLTG